MKVKLLIGVKIHMNNHFLTIIWCFLVYPLNYVLLVFLVNQKSNEYLVFFNFCSQKH